jgi:hypothetical protein
MKKILFATVAFFAIRAIAKEIKKPKPKPREEVLWV